MNRFQELRDILDQGRFFKVVCGAGNEDPQEVNRLCLVYTLAGALGIDLSANVEVVEAGMRGVDLAFELAAALDIQLTTRPFINVSVGLEGDPHIRKACILAESCTECGLCVNACDQEAIVSNPVKILAQRCIGCGKCAEVCEFEAVEYYTRKVDFNDILPRCLAAGAETFELHAIVADDEAVLRDWSTVADILPDQFISMCLDRSQLSDRHLIRRVREAAEIAGDRLIIQADGAPMSGGDDDFRTTLQAVACAELVEKSGLPARILVSGGTNGRTGELTRLCGLTVHGVSIGTFARNLVRDEIKSPDFPTDRKTLVRAVEKAQRLVDENIREIQRG
jgi:Fe-S-cluster-containing hydrogenase component 2